MDIELNKFSNFLLHRKKKITIHYFLSVKENVHISACQLQLSQKGTVF